MTDELHALLDAPLPPLEPLTTGTYVVYGAGNIGREVAACLTDSGRHVGAFIDAKVVGMADGVQVHAPADDAVRTLAANGATAVIGLFNFAVDPWPIHCLLVDLGFRRVLTFYEFQEHFSLPPHFWLTSRAHVLERRRELEATWNLLEDEISQRLFLDIVAFRLKQDLRLMREPEWDQQYLPDGLPRPVTPLRLVEGGAFTGDTIEYLLDRGIPIGAVLAFEPDPLNFRALSDTVRRRAAQVSQATLLPCGLSDTTVMASFHSGQGAASRVAEHGEVHVQLLALDQVSLHFAPTYLKLDIEGSELAALQGAADTIREYKPSLAVCLYHTPDHLWQVPLYIRELLPTHRIALRYHAYQAFDLVAYAFPRD